MSLDEFKLQLKARMELAKKVDSKAEEIYRQMAALQPKLSEFEELSARFISKLIRPRLEATIACFPNANLGRGEQTDRCSASFGYCERFPASCKVEFALEHDDRVENLVVRYEFRITPVFHKYEPHDKLIVSLKSRNEEAVTTWIESKLLGLLDDYLRLDRGDETLDEDLVTDPVCGMRITRKAATGQECYRGHAYFFCTSDCREKFAKEPAKYVWFRT